MRSRRGFTLIEVLIVIGIIAILAGVVVVAINPARQFALARNSQRISNVNAILNAMGQNMADNKGMFTCASVPIATQTYIGSASGEINLYACIVPTYMPELPFDPGNPTASVFGTLVPHITSATNYETGYKVSQDTSGRITVCAPGAVENAIASSSAICVTR